MKMKTCNCCKKELPANREYFHKHKGFKDGLRQPCIACRSIKKEREPIKITVDGKLVNAKECRVCKKVLEATEDNFCKEKRGFLGVSTRCKECDKD
jgi:hypothetical protein